MKMHVRMASVLAVAAVVAGLSLVSAGPAAADTEQDAAAAFTTIDGTLYGGGPSIGDSAPRAYLVPYATCLQLQNDGDLQNEQAWKDAVRQFDTDPGGPGFLVLDCEQLYFAGHSAATAADYEQEMEKIQGWAREVEPSKPIGWYGLVDHTSAGNIRYYTQLLAADPNSVFFPSDYTFDPDLAGWYADLLADLADARAVDPKVKVYPFIWPQYHDHAAAQYAKKFLPSEQWIGELRALAATDADGVVVWGGNTVSNTCDATCQATARSKPWLQDTRDFMTALAQTPPDLALDKPATASSVIRNLVDRAAGLAVDGDPTTRWASAYADDQWLQVDLGSADDISGLRIDWHTAYGSSYKIQVSDDGATWHDVIAVTDGAGGSDWLDANSPGWDAAAAHGRYIRMLGLTRGTQYSFALTGFHVYGAPVFGSLTAAVTGDTHPGSTVSAELTPAPRSGTSYTYSWAIDGRPVAGADGADFTIPASAAVGSTVTVTVTRSREGYTAAPVSSDAVKVTAVPAGPGEGSGAGPREGSGDGSGASAGDGGTGTAGGGATDPPQAQGEDAGHGGTSADGASGADVAADAEQALSPVVTDRADAVHSLAHTGAGLALPLGGAMMLVLGGAVAFALGRKRLGRRSDFDG